MGNEIAKITIETPYSLILHCLKVSYYSLNMRTDFRAYNFFFKKVVKKC
jgi:hypothetical protein